MNIQKSCKHIIVSVLIIIGFSICTTESFAALNLGETTKTRSGEFGSKKDCNTAKGFYSDKNNPQGYAEYFRTECAPGKGMVDGKDEGDIKKFYYYICSDEDICGDDQDGNKKKNKLTIFVQKNENQAIRLSEQGTIQPSKGENLRVIFKGVTSTSELCILEGNNSECAQGQTFNIIENMKKVPNNDDDAYYFIFTDEYLKTLSGKLVNLYVTKDSNDGTKKQFFQIQSTNKQVSQETTFEVKIGNGKWQKNLGGGGGSEINITGTGGLFINIMGISHNDTLKVKGVKYKGEIVPENSSSIFDLKKSFNLEGVSNVNIKLGIESALLSMQDSHINNVFSDRVTLTINNKVLILKRKISSTVEKNIPKSRSKTTMSIVVKKNGTGGDNRYKVTSVKDQFEVTILGAQDTDYICEKSKCENKITLGSLSGKKGERVISVTGQKLMDMMSNISGDVLHFVIKNEAHKEKSQKLYFTLDLDTPTKEKEETKEKIRDISIRYSITDEGGQEQTNKEVEYFGGNPLLIEFSGIKLSDILSVNGGAGQTLGSMHKSYGREKGIKLSSGKVKGIITLSDSNNITFLIGTDILKNLGAETKIQILNGPYIKLIKKNEKRSATMTSINTSGGGNNSISSDKDTFKITITGGKDDDYLCFNHLCPTNKVAQTGVGVYLLKDGLPLKNGVRTAEINGEFLKNFFVGEKINLFLKSQKGLPLATLIYSKSEGNNDGEAENTQNKKVEIFKNTIKENNKNNILINKATDRIKLNFSNVVAGDKLCILDNTTQKCNPNKIYTLKTLLTNSSVIVKGQWMMQEMKKNHVLHFRWKNAKGEKVTDFSFRVNLIDHIEFQLKNEI